MSDEAAEVAPLPTPSPGPRPQGPRLATHGFRIALHGQDNVELRLAGVEDFGGATIGELTVHGTVAWKWLSVSAEIAGTAAASDIWSSAGVGNAVVDARFLFGTTWTNAIGLRATIPVGSATEVAWWGTVPEATVRTAGGALWWEGAIDRWVFTAHSGFRSQAYFAYDYSRGIWDLGLGVATVQPLGGPWSLVAEVEGAWAPLAAYPRVGVRWAAAPWSVDLGVAAPIPAMITDPTVQVWAAARWQPG